MPFIQSGIKSAFQPFIVIIFIFNLPLCNTFALPPNLGTAASFVLFTRTGAVGNTGTSNITGNIGTDNGAINGFGAPSILTGNSYAANAVTSQCALDVQSAYDQIINTAATSTSHTPAFGSGETLLPGVYAITGAGSVAGNLTLDAQGNQNAIFIFKFSGAFTTGAAATITLTNGALACNVFWAADGAIAMAATTAMKGTVIANNGAVSMGAGGSLEGRLFSTSGAVAVSNNVLAIPTLYNFPHGVIIVGSGAVLNIGKNATLVTNSDIDNRGTLTNAGSIILNGDATQSFPGSAGSIPLMNVLEVKNTGAGIALNNGIKIGKELKLTNGNLALGNYDVTMLSNAAQTAAVSAIGAGAGVSYGTGRFIIERFINVGTGGHGKSWQFLSVPANGQTIRDTWQESGAATVGYGTQVTNPLGTGAGYDLTTPNSSIKTYVSASNNFDAGPSSTAALIDNPKGYMLFVRGDRTVASGSGSAPTALRIKGTIFTPANPPAAITVNAGKFESVGNPYASQIDFTLLTRTGGVDNKYYTWDPTLGGAYGVGAYQTITATNSWVPVPGGGNYTGAHKNIESGQAFIVKSTSTAGTINFAETVKTGSSVLVNKTARPTTNNRGFIRSSLLRNTGAIADGNAAAFDSDLSNEVDGDDAQKIMNGAENFGLKRNNILLAVEGRSLIVTTDTLFYFISNLQQQPYSFLIVPENMDQTKEAWLVDNFLQTQTAVSLIDSTVINFTVTADPNSSKTDRFMLVFKPLGVLEIAETNLQAFRNTDNSISVNWINASENNVMEYVVEKSADARNFNAIHTEAAEKNNGNNANYNYKDVYPFNGNNFYRIKIKSLNDIVKYSAIVKVAPVKNMSDISVYPNPVTEKLLSLHFGNKSYGSYKIALINEAGQQIWSSSILYNNNSAGKITVALPTNLAAGNYNLTLFDKKGKTFKTLLIIL